MKRSEYITVMLPLELKQKIQKIAEEKKWTLSQTVFIILNEYFEQK